MNEGTPGGFASRRCIIRDLPMRRSPAIILGITTALSLLVVSSRAADSFDAPKRLVAMGGIALAFAAACWSPLRMPPVHSRPHRAAVACTLAALLLVAISAFLSPRRDVAFDALRTMLVFASVLWIAAVDGAVFPAIANGFVAGAGVNAAIAVMQAGGISPTATANAGDRAAAFGLLGNTGIAGLVFAFAATIVIGWVLAKPRFATIALLALLLAGIVVTRSVTPIFALAAGAAAATLLSQRTPRAIRIAIPVGALLAIALAVMTLASRATLPSLNALLSFRLGPWAAAVEMVRDRPMTGFGPGTFAAEFAPQLLDAELRWQARLMNPVLTGSYAEAHNDFLQAAAESGVPAAIVFAVVIGIVSVLLVRRAPDAVTGGLLVAAVVAALTWFPLHRAPTALLIVAAVGHAWRLSAGAVEPR